MLSPNGPDHKPWHKPFQIVFAPINAGQGKGSFEDYINRALEHEYEIFGKIEYVTIEEEIWGLTSIKKKAENEKPKP